MDLEYIFRLGGNNSGKDVGNLQTPLERQPEVAIPYLVVMLIVTVVGCFGNCLVFASVLLERSLRTVGNIFILNLAFADFCVTAFVDPFNIVGIVLGEHWFENKGALCDAIACVCLTSCFCSLLSIGAISFNRYIHICHYSVYDRIFTLRNTILMCLALWVVSFFAELPNFVGWGDHVYDTRTLSCVWDRTASLSYTIFFAGFGIVTPIIIISICYLRIYIFVKKSKNKIGQTRSKADKAQTALAKEKKDSVHLARTLFLIFVVFAVCWLPYATIVVADVYNTFPTGVHAASVAVAHANSSINSIVYGTTNKQFRKSYLKIVRLDFCRNRTSAMTTGNSMTVSRTLQTNTEPDDVKEQSHAPTSSLNKRVEDCRANGEKY